MMTRRDPLMHRKAWARSGKFGVCGLVMTAAILCPPAIPQTNNRLPAGDRIQVVFTQIPATPHKLEDAASATFDDPIGLPSGTRIVTVDLSATPPEVINLTPGFDAAAKPDVSFDGERILFIARRARDDHFSVWEMTADGGFPRRVASRPGHCRSAIYLSAIYTIDADQPVDLIAFAADEPGEDYPSLYTCRLDGSRLRRITFTPDGAFDPHQLANGRILFSSRSPTEPSAPSKVSRFTVNTDGTDVFPFSGKSSARDHGEHRLRSTLRPGANGTYALAEFGSIGSRTPTRIILDDPGWHDVHPVAVAARPRPAGRSSVVDDRRTTGKLYCLDAYMSGTHRMFTPHIDRVRVMTVPPAAGHVLGEIPVEDDGSFFMEIPARTPLRLQTIRADGRVIREMHSWFWVMPKENRGCIGCHEDRNLSPPNRYVTALRKPPHAVGILDSSTAPARERQTIADGPTQ